MNKILNAIDFATAAHKGQTRKGKPDVPYITHPLAVGILLAQAGAEENVIIAGILHDTIEDCKPYVSIKKRDIEKEFGKSIAEMVDDVTEQDKTLSWNERKRLALEHVPHMSHGSLLVKAVDVLHNMTDQIADYEIEGDKMFVRFNAPKDAQLDRYEKLVAALDLAWPQNPILPALKESLLTLQKLWN